MGGCGCKICKAGLGELTNRLILEGESPIAVLQELEKQGVNASKKLLKKHLAAFEIDYPEEQYYEGIAECEPVTIELNDIDFSEYEFALDNPGSVITYLQKLNLKVYLNQMRITLQAQQDVIDGKAPSVPAQILRNLAIAYGILDKSTAMSTQINQQQALKIVEAMGFDISNSSYLLPENVSNKTDTETD